MTIPTALNLSYLNARRVLPQQCRSLHLIQVGCGGIGGQLAPSTARIAKECQTRFEHVDVSFYDGDTVEDKNIRRQQFCEAEIGRNKADSLAFRLNMAWGMDIIANPTHLTKDTMHSITKYDTLTILLGCVDNANARRVLHAHLSRQHPETNSPVWWIDGGCIRTQGQILIGNTQRIEQLKAGFTLPGVITTLPSPALLHPELLKKQADERPRRRQSCAKHAITDPQSLTINGIVAAHMADYLLRLLVTKDLTRFATYIDMNSGSVRSLYNTDTQLEQSLNLKPGSLTPSTSSVAA